ncbi:MAG: hypothetical protein AAB495_03530 [Patescibacteria group bacterium]
MEKKKYIYLAILWFLTIASLVAGLGGSTELFEATELLRAILLVGSTTLFVDIWIRCGSVETRFAIRLSLWILADLGIAFNAYI